MSKGLARLIAPAVFGVSAGCIQVSEIPIPAPDNYQVIVHRQEGEWDGRRFLYQDYQDGEITLEILDPSGWDIMIFDTNGDGRVDYWLIGLNAVSQERIDSLIDLNEEYIQDIYGRFNREVGRD